MNAARTLLVLVTAAGGVHYWHQHEAALATASVLAAGDDFGFIDLPRAQGQRSDTVYIVAAVNCPHEAAQRADRLARALAGQGIPTVRTNSVQFSPADLEEVESEYRRVIDQRSQGPGGGALPPVS